MAGQDGPNRRGGLIQLLAVDIDGGIGEVEIVHAVDGDEMYVEMGHLEPGDHQTDPSRREDPLDCLGDRLRDLEEVVPEIGWAIGPEINLLSGHDQGVARPQRVDRQEGDAAVVTPDKRAGDLSLDDLREDGCQ